MERQPFLASSFFRPEHGNILWSRQWEVEFNRTMFVTNFTQYEYEGIQRALGRAEITQLSQYDEIYNFFMNHYGGAQFGMSPPKYWARDNTTDPMLSVNTKWNQDKVFAQARLMGDNPLQLQRVTKDCDVGVSWDSLFSAHLNKTFSWTSAIQAVLGESVSLDSVSGFGHRLCESSTINLSLTCCKTKL